MTLGRIRIRLLNKRAKLIRWQFQHWASIDADTELEALADESGQPGIVLAALAGSSAQPFVKAAMGHRHDPAHHAGWPDATVPGYEGVLHCGSLAK